MVTSIPCIAGTRRGARPTLPATQMLAGQLSAAPPVCGAACCPQQLPQHAPMGNGRTARHPVLRPSESAEPIPLAMPTGALRLQSPRALASWQDAWSPWQPWRHGKGSFPPPTPPVRLHPARHFAVQGHACCKSEWPCLSAAPHQVLLLSRPFLAWYRAGLHPPSECAQA